MVAWILTRSQWGLDSVAKVLAFAPWNSNTFVEVGAVCAVSAKLVEWRRRGSRSSA